VHELLHVAILVATIVGAGGLAVLFLWPLLGNDPMPGATRRLLLASAGLALILFLLEWRVVH